MYPVYGYMDPYTQTYPCQREQNYYPCHSYHMPSQMRADTVQHPLTVVPSYFGSNFAHQAPFDQSGCCHNNCSPCNYSFKHPFPSPQPLLYGPYPPYPNVYPPHFVPPPHYPVDQARYDYDKPRNHCCGCPNHACSRRDDTSPKIEEQKAERNKGQSLVQLPNYPNPVIWVPRPSLKEKDDEKASEPLSGQWTGWVPLDMNILKGLKHDSEEKKDQQVGDRTGQQCSPFPIIWMPGYDKLNGGTQDVKEITPKEVTPKSMEDWPSTFKIVSLNHHQNENQSEKPRVVQDEPKDQVQPEVTKEKESKIKTIPIMKLEEKDQKQISNPDKPKEKIDEKHKQDNEAKKAPERKPSSPAKSSKLPPVCLRVDPLPRKKTVNGASRSPSPPARADERTDLHNEDQSARKEERERVPQKDIPAIEVKDKSSDKVEKEQKHEENMLDASLKNPTPGVSSKENCGSDLKDKEVTEGSEVGERKNSERKTADREEKRDVEVTGSSESKHVEEKKGRRREFSEDAAAAAIQSAYRGFEVRRWQPLEKLRKIAKVREHVGSIRDQIQSAEASSKGWDAKQRVVVGETIMNLLLQLDTIQGLHPSIREIRKSVARELICLQEKLDSSASQSIKENELVKVGEGKASDAEAVNDAEAVKLGSCLVTVPPVEHEASGESIDATMNQPVQVEVEALADGSSTDEVAMALDEHESLKQVEGENKAEDKPSEEANIACEQDMGLSPAAESSPAFLQVLDKIIPQLEERGDNAEEKDEPTDLMTVSGLASEEIKEFANLIVGSEADKRSGELSSEVKDADSELERLGDETGGKDEATVLTTISEFASEESQESVGLTVDNEADKLCSGDVVIGTEVKEIVEPCQEVKNLEEHEADSQQVVDSVADDDAKVDQKLLESPSEDVEQQSNSREDVPQKIEELESDVRVLQASNEVVFETVMASSLEQKDDPHNVQEETPQLLPSAVEISNMIGASSNMQIPEGCKVELGGEDADNSPPNVGMKFESAEGANDENELKIALEEINGSGREVLSPAERETTDELPPAPVVEYHVRENDDTPTPRLDSDEADEHCVKALQVDLKKEENKLLEENQKLREMLEKLLEEGKEQLGTIRNLSGRVKDLEKKLAHKKRVKLRRNKAMKPRSCDVSCH